MSVMTYILRGNGNKEVFRNVRAISNFLTTQCKTHI